MAYTNGATFGQTMLNNQNSDGLGKPELKRGSSEKENGLAQTAEFPSLESQESINTHRDDYLGCTEESNWVIPGRLLVGAYPSVNDDDLNEEILTSVLSLGVTTFVCLQQEYRSHGVTEYMWRNGLALR